MVEVPMIDTVTSHPTEAVARVVAEEVSMEVEEVAAAEVAADLVVAAVVEVAVVETLWVNLDQD